MTICHYNLEVGLFKRSAWQEKWLTIYVNLWCLSLTRFIASDLKYFQGLALLAAFYDDENAHSYKI